MYVYVCMPLCYFNLYEVWSMMMCVTHVGEMSRIYAGDVAEGGFEVFDV